MDEKEDGGYDGGGSIENQFDLTNVQGGSQVTQVLSRLPVQKHVHTMVNDACQGLGQSNFELGTIFCTLSVAHMHHP